MFDEQYTPEYFVWNILVPILLLVYILVEIVSTAYLMIIKKIDEMGYLVPTLDGTNLEVGSISQAMYYFYVWRYLSCTVFPDITHLRYPPSKTDAAEGRRLNSKRFYAHTRRIWLKTL